MRNNRFTKLLALIAAGLLMTGFVCYKGGLLPTHIKALKPTHATYTNAPQQVQTLAVDTPPPVEKTYMSSSKVVIMMDKPLSVQPPDSFRLIRTYESSMRMLSLRLAAGNKLHFPWRVHQARYKKEFFRFSSSKSFSPIITVPDSGLFKTPVSK